MKLVYHDRFLGHRQRDEDHPERPERLIAIRDRLQAEKLWTDVLEPQPAAAEDILRIHHANYIKTLGRMGEGVWDRDTYVRPETLEIATLAAGAGVLAAETAWTGRETAWALVRPPGHHATAASAMGFCYLNSLAIAAARHVALGRGRVAIVDVDVHHGNGTQEAFYDNPDVLVISAHESPLFPGTGTTDETGMGTGAGLNINVPLPYGSGDATYRNFMGMIVEPALRRWRPSIVLVSFGTDIHYLDPLAGLTLSSQGCVELAARIESLAAELCDGRVAYFLEGGYHLDSLSEIIAAAVGRASGRKVKLKFTDVKDTAGTAAGVIDFVADRIEQGILVPA
ncbi:histone deacetylase [bacterium]|nr:histone deacetylase [bacterium]